MVPSGLHDPRRKVARRGHHHSGHQRMSESVVVSASQVEVPLTEVTRRRDGIDRAEIETRQLHSVADAPADRAGHGGRRDRCLGAMTGVFPAEASRTTRSSSSTACPRTGFGGDFDFGHLSTANVDRIEVVRGPQSALFGSNAIGAVVRLTSRRGGPPSAAFNVEGDQFGTSRVSAVDRGVSSGSSNGVPPRSAAV